MKTQNLLRKATVLATLGIFILGLATQTVHAASTDIADVPMAVKSQVAPNIVMNLDDSGSMHWEFLPEEGTNFLYSLFLQPRGTSQYGGSDYSNQLPNFNDGNLHNFFGRASQNNAIYYNPNVTYQPWSNADGSLMAIANPTAAYFNPGNPGAGTVNLTVANTRAADWFSDLGTGNLAQASCDPGCGVNHTYWPITYFIYNAGSKLLRSSYTKVEITTSTPAAATFTAPNGTVRTRDQEVQNFANWYQYYRSRVHTARAGIGRAFASVGITPRVGFGTINQGSLTIDGVSSPGTMIRGVRLFTGTDRTDWFNTLYTRVIPASGTPLRRSADDVGRYFSRIDDAGPWGATPGGSGGTQHSCRQNYHILMTDGYWNGLQAPTAAARANNDGTNGTIITHANGTTTYQYTAGAPFSDTFSDTLADVAMYYWRTDIRPDLANDVQSNATDDAFWQHVTTFTVALGLSGTIPQGKVQFIFAGIREFSGLDTDRNFFISTAEAAGHPYLNQSANFNVADTNTDGKLSISEFLVVWGNITRFNFDTNGDLQLSAAEVAGFAELTQFFSQLDTNADGFLSVSEISASVTWPDPTGSSPTRLDDLAHAGINGRGGFFSASDPEVFAQSLADALNDIAVRTGAAAAVAVANPNVVGGDNASYASEYNSGTWTGELKAFPIDLTTGQPNQSTPIWTTSAQTQLNARTPASRFIATYSGTTGTGQGRQFQPTSASTATKLSVTQQNLLNTPVSPPGTSDGAAVVNYLRGDRSGELAGTYRSRTHLLGDIINSEPQVIREPTANYTDAGYKGVASGAGITFKENNASRARIVLQGANDGMLHAFNALTGAEAWAYIPNIVLGNLNNLSRKTGFVHKFYVDGTSQTSDVDFSNTDGVAGSPPPSWKTLVTGGLGKGGRGYYALDVTATTAADEAAVASKVLWEWPNSATNATVKLNIGYSFGRPLLVKTKARGWVVIVPSGYNNGTNAGDSGGDGQGYLFVLNARTGGLIKAIGTGVGSVSDPSGLAFVSGYVEAGDVDNTVEYVYGGDLKGNVWRFDLTANSNINFWSVQKLATLVDGSGNFQPVTTEPELAKIKISNVFRRFVFVGTGQYLGDTDVTGSTDANTHASQTQSMYGLVDDLTTPSGAVITPLRTNLQQQTFTTNADGSRTASNNGVDYATKKGWYIDLTVSGERVNTNPALAVNALAFTTNIPSANPCTPGGSSFFNVLDYASGGFLTGSTVPWSSQSLGNTLASRVVLIKLPSGAIKALARKSDATTVSVTVPLPATGTGVTRRSWREILQ